MDEKDLPSSSDESDADFVPKEEDYSSRSGSEVSDCASSGEDNAKKSRKRKKKSKKFNKKSRSEGNGEEIEEQKNDETEEKSKIDVDALYADFKKDVNNKTTKEIAPAAKIENKTLEETTDTLVEESNLKKSVGTLRPKGVPSLSNRGRRGGLSGVLSQLGKKDKMTTLQKSQLDWNNFKKSEGIEEEIKMHNRGKDGYLEKQDFLQRTDLRQFEIEKDLRSARRKF